jgi:hypothetical protein
MFMFKIHMGLIFSIEYLLIQYVNLVRQVKSYEYFAGQAHDLIGLRNLVIILLLGFLGIRTSALIGINIENVDVTSCML